MEDRWRPGYHIQKWVIRLDIRDGQEQWLAYGTSGRIGNANFSQAFQYDTRRLAEISLKKLRRDRAWPNAEIFGVLAKREVR